MPFRSKIPNLAQGVSKQSPAFKEFNRPKRQENFYPHPVLGLMDRPPSEFIVKPSSPVQTASADASWHLISMREDEQYYMVVEESGIRVWGVDGTEYHVENSAGDFDYLAQGATSVEPYQILSVKDFTYILNRTITVENTATVSTAEVEGEDESGDPVPVGDGKNWVWVRQGAYDGLYEITGVNAEDDDPTTSVVDWRVVAITSNGSASKEYALKPITTDNIAEHIQRGGGLWRGYENNNLSTDVANQQGALSNRPSSEQPTHLALGKHPTGAWSTTAAAAFVWDEATGDASKDVFTVNRFGSVVQFVPVTPRNRTVEIPRTNCSISDTALVGISRTVESLSDLPAEGFNGKKVIVDADPDVGSPVSYYVFEVESPDADNADAGNGVWQETYGFGVNLELDATTMPHGLTRKVDATGAITGTIGEVYFDYAVIEWDDRLVGDEDTAPTPSFVGETIRHLFFYRNRLGCLSKDNVIFSEVGEFTNFYRTTVEQFPTTDPIDVRANSRKVREFIDSFEIQGRLFIRAEDVVMEVGDSDSILSAETIQIRAILDMHSDPLAAPVTLENSVLLTDKLQRYTQINEIIPSGDARFQSIRATDEVLDMISEQIRHMTASPTLGLAVLVPVSSNTLYCHSYLWQGQEKVQSAWWTLTQGANDVIRHAEFFEDTLYLVVERDSKVILTKITFDLPKQQTADWEPLCDDRVPLSDLSPVLSAVFTAGDTAFLMPYDLDAGYTYYVVLDGGGAGDKGTYYTISGAAVFRTPADALVVAGEDLTSESGYIGRAYTRTFEFDKFRPKSQNKNRGQTAIANAEVLWHELVLNYEDSIEFNVNTANRRSYTQTFSSVPASGDPPLETGVKRFNVHGEASRTSITIENTSPLPSIIQSGEAVFSLRAKGRETSL